MENKKLLIDKTAFLTTLAYIKPNATDDCGMYYGYTIGAIEEALRRTPTVDAVEVVHGRWEKQLGLDHCSVCHKVRPYDVQDGVAEYWTCDYCPNCGAKMDRKDDT